MANPPIATEHVVLLNPDYDHTVIAAAGDYELPYSSLDQYPNDFLLQEIYTPNPLKARSENGIEPLLSAIDSDGVKERLQAAAEQSQDSWETQRLTEAQRIIGHVNDALFYRSGFAKDGLWHDRYTPEAVLLNQETNCYGYTHVASRALEVAGIDHFIGYINGHTFLILGVGQDTRQSAWFLDPFAPSLTQDLQHTLSRERWSSVRQDMEAYQRGSAPIDTAQFGDHLGQSFDVLADKYVWMDKSNRNISEETLQEDHLNEILSRNTRTVLSVFPMEAGRSMLQHHNAFETAYYAQDIHGMLSHLSELRGIFPDRDGSAEHTEIQYLIGALCEEGDTFTAYNAVETYFAGPDPPGDTSLLQKKEACLSIIARHTLETASARMSHA